MTINWPDNKSFAFTIFDDTDNATIRDKNITPLIIDISDQVLIHQSQVRKKFYRSRNYTIEEFNVIDNEISEKNTRKYIRKSNIPKILNEVNNSRLDSDSD